MFCFSCSTTACSVILVNVCKVLQGSQILLIERLVKANKWEVAFDFQNIPWKRMMTRPALVSAN